MKRTLFLSVLLVLSAFLGMALTEEFQEPGLTSLHERAPEFPPPQSAFPAQEGTSSPTGPLGTGQLGPSRGGQITPGGAGGIASASAGAEATPDLGTPTAAWINSRPLRMSQLLGKVVLIDFWEYTCINCIRTFDDNKKWYQRYHPYGFEIIGVHDPEFDIAYPVDNVRRAVKRFGLPYPVVVDDQFQIWKAYNNSTWPNRFLIDAKGYIRFNRDGEGADSSFEHAIQKLLQEAHPGLTFPADYAISADEDPQAPECGTPTQEMYVGDWYGRGVLANPEGYRDGRTLEYKLPGSVEDGRAVVSGRWEADKNGMIYRGRPKGGAPSGGELRMRYRARELYSVLNVSHGKPARLYIEQDGKDLTAQNKGVDVALDSSGHSYIEVREPRMYYLVGNPSFGEHTVELFPTSPGLVVNSFTFGNSCQTKFTHL